MGSSSSKKKKVVQQAVPKPPQQAEETPRNPSLPRSPPAPTIPSRQPSIRDKSPSLRSRVSAKRNSANLKNGSERRISVRRVSNKTVPENDDVSLPPIDNQNYKSASRTSVRPSSVSLHTPAPTSRPRVGSQSSSDSFGHKHRKGLLSSHDQTGRCSKCPHCRRMNITTLSIASTPVPQWLTKSPGNDQVRINMDNYDIEAVKEKIVAKNHHLLGSYDYQPYLTMDTADGDYDPTKENYYTQPFIAKMKPRVTPLRTPFPDYESLVRRDQRLNKPYALPLFD